MQLPSEQRQYMVSGPKQVVTSTSTSFSTSPTNGQADKRDILTMQPVVLQSEAQPTQPKPMSHLSRQMARREQRITSSAYRGADDFTLMEDNPLYAQNYNGPVATIREAVRPHSYYPPDIYQGRIPWRYENPQLAYQYTL